MRKIIEDTITRNKDFQEERRLRVKRFKELKAPDIIIETEEMLSKMTLAEYNIYCQQLEEEDKKVKLEYAKNNPAEKEVLKNIYNYAGFRASTDAQLNPIRQLELFKDRQKVEADASLTDADKKKKLADIDAALAKVK